MEKVVFSGLWNGQYLVWIEGKFNCRMKKFQHKGLHISVQNRQWTADMEETPEVQVEVSKQNEKSGNDDLDNVDDFLAQARKENEVKQSDKSETDSDPSLSSSTSHGEHVNQTNVVNKVNVDKVDVSVQKNLNKNQKKKMNKKLKPKAKVNEGVVVSETDAADHSQLMEEDTTVLKNKRSLSPLKDNSEDRDSSVPTKKNKGEVLLLDEEDDEENKVRPNRSKLIQKTLKFN